MEVNFFMKSFIISLIRKFHEHEMVTGMLYVLAHLKYPVILLTDVF